MTPRREPRPTRRSALLRGAALGLAALGPIIGCQGERGFTILGYQFGADKLYDTSIHTVYVPLFHNRAFQTTPDRGMEVEITKAVIRDIEAKTPYKVVSDPEKADTELLGYLVSIEKFILNRNQQNTTREADITIHVEVVWRDLRDGRILSNPRPPGLLIPTPVVPGMEIPQFDPTLPVPPPVSVVQQPLPVTLIASGRLLPELGETNATASQMAVNKIAIQIVSMMEKPW